VIRETQPAAASGTKKQGSLSRPRRNASPGGSDRLALRPRARILRAFGDELISSELVAVTELVKNAYDADATGVLIRILSDHRGHDALETSDAEIKAESNDGPMLEVIDNGHGMDIRTVRGTWFEPATASRRRSPRSEQLRRVVMGEKGLGRFAAARLGNELELVSRRAGMATEVYARFDWTQFDDPDLYLDEVQLTLGQRAPVDIVPGGTIERIPPSASEPAAQPHGTILRIKQLRDEWTVDDLMALRRHLSRMKARPTTINGHDDFSMWVQGSAEAEPSEIGPPDALWRPAYSIEGRVEGDGHYHLTARVGEDEPKDLNGRFVIDKSEHQPRCGPFEIDLRVWDRDAVSMDELGRQLKATRAEAREELDHLSGVSVYRDGFRVLPYGEPHQDWLRLDLRRVQNPTKALSNNQIVGQVFITREGNPELRDQTNREGLTAGPALDDFRDLIVDVISELEVRRYEARHPHRTSKETRRGGLFSGFDLSDIRLTVVERHADDKELLAAVDAKESDLQDRVAAVLEVLARYRRLATLGQLVDGILHDGRLAISKIGGELHNALSGLNKLGEGSTGAVTLARTAMEQVQVHNRTLSLLFKRIEPFGGRQHGRPVKVRLEDVIAEAFSLFQSELDDAGIVVTLPHGTTEVTADSSELQIVIVNLLTNSIYWVKQRSRSKRAIEVQVSRDPHKVEILFCDSGPGVPDEFRDRIFDPYFSTRKNGVGLGLTIAGEIVTDYYAGELELIDGGPLGGATFRVTLRYRV